MTISVPIQIIDLQGDGYHPLIEVLVNGMAHILVLDTGASKTAFDHNILLRSGVGSSIIASEKLSTGLGVTDMASSTALINSIQIGELFIVNFEVAVLDLSTINIAYSQLNHPEVLGVLGGDILMRYSAVIDYGKKIIQFNNDDKEKGPVT
jgi:predicted aspartyl protease